MAHLPVVEDENPSSDGGLGLLLSEMPWWYQVTVRTRHTLRRALGSALNWLHAPGAIKPVDFEDGVIGERFRVEVRPGYTVISVGCRDYYFDRVTGEFDGTGYGCR